MVMLVLVTRGVGELVRDVVGVVVTDVDGGILVVGGHRVGVGIAKDAGEGVGCTAVVVHFVGDTVRGVTGRRTGSVVSGISGAAHTVGGGVDVEECYTVFMCEVVVVVGAAAAKN